MMDIKIIAIFLIAVISGCQQRGNPGVFSQVCTVTQQKVFFKAEELLQHKENELSELHRNFLQAITANVFNQTAFSEKSIDLLIFKSQDLPDFLGLMRVYYPAMAVPIVTETLDTSQVI